MPAPLFVRPLSTEEQDRLRGGLRSGDAFTLRRCQILLASAHGQPLRRIAANLGCAKGTVANAINAFHAVGLACLKEKSSRPHSAKPFLTADHAPALEDLLHHSPRLAGKPTSLWTLDLVAEVCSQQGWTPRVLSGEAIRQALLRLGISWQRAKHWITSPDPAYARKKKARDRRVWQNFLAALRRLGHLGLPVRFPQVAFAQRFEGHDRLRVVRIPSHARALQPLRQGLAA
jgi:transposase